MRNNFQSEGKSQKRYYFTRKKYCMFCKEKIKFIDYKDFRTLGNYILETGKILPARVSGTCGYHQKQLTKAIKRARHMGLVKFVEPRRG